MGLAPGYTTLLAEEYFRLVARDEKLTELEQAGACNCEGFGPEREDNDE